LGRRRIKVVTESDIDLARRARKWVEETTLAQGVSVHLTDPVALLAIVRIFGWDRPASESAPTTVARI
jgi:hypothetical protein